MHIGLDTYREIHDNSSFSSRDFRAATASPGDRGEVAMGEMPALLSISCTMLLAPPAALSSLFTPYIEFRARPGKPKQDMRRARSISKVEEGEWRRSNLSRSINVLTQAASWPPDQKLDTDDRILWENSTC
jgi:hypothetical protein